MIFLQNDGLAGAPDEPFQPGWDLFFPPQPHEKIVRKKKDNGFDGTDLHAILTSLGIRTVAMCGVLSEMCLAATARAAMEHGYGVLLPHDAHATYDVPAGPGSEGVPAAMAARAAEWSLGDESIFCLATLAKKTSSLSVDALTEAGRDFTYFGARGRVTISEAGTEMSCYLMKSIDLDYELIRSF